MERQLERELMDDPDQALAYSRADFSEENEYFVMKFLQTFPDFVSGHILDLGCGPGDIPIRLARALPNCRVTGVDGSAAMIKLAEQAVQEAGLGNRITLRCERIQDLSLDDEADAIVSNSLLHHLENPYHFWGAIKKLAAPQAPVQVMDLLRPESPEDAQAIVDRYAASESDQLRRDFYNSLLAAFTEGEVTSQLAALNLTRLLIDVPDDRHWIVTGVVL